VHLCANENIPELAIATLRAAGHDVLWIRETMPGSADTVVLTRAHTEQRILITFDKDFGDLVFHYGKLASEGIILFRISQPNAGVVARRILATIQSREDWAGHYSVIEDHAIRMRVLPN
jgi:predicted nuclease of predicted toxin-antitoxin system